MRRLTLVLVIMLALSFTALAQEFPRMEVSAGYQFLRAQTGAPTSFGAINSSGFNGNVAFNFAKNLGIVGDLGFAKVTKTGRTDDKLTTFMFGPQFKYRGEARLSPFGHFLVGAAHCNDGYTIGTPMDPAIVLPAQTEWAYGFGGGADVRLTNLISARVAQVDYFRTHFGNYHQNNIRISMGITLRFGEGTAK